MEYTTLGRSGLKVSRAALGAMNFGTEHVMTVTPEQDAARIVGEFLDAGHNLVDTADMYSAGQSEEVVGRAIGSRRDEVVLATKAAAPMGTGPNDRGLSRKHLTSALEASLRRLGTDYVDLYQCHHWDDDTPVEETMDTLDGFVRSGKVRYIGASNYTAAQIVEAQLTARSRGGAEFVSLQAQYSLVARQVEEEVVPTAQRFGMGTLVWSPLGGGLLTGRYRRGQEPEDGSRLERMKNSGIPGGEQIVSGLLNTRNLDIVDAVSEIASGLGRTPASVALAWVAQRPGVAAVLVGPRTLQQVRDNLAAIADPLPTEAITRLDEVSAAPATGAIDPTRA